MTMLDLPHAVRRATKGITASMCHPPSW